MCHAEIGIHHHIVGASLLRYAQDSSWREDNRRLSNGEQVNRLAALSLKLASQLIWWLLAAALERCSCLSKSFTPTKKSLKIMSPASMTKPYFVSECRVAGFIRTLLSGLARSIKTM